MNSFEEYDVWSPYSYRSKDAIIISNKLFGSTVLPLILKKFSSIFLTSTEVSLFLNSIWKRIQEFHPKIRTDDEREQRLSYYIMSKLSVKKNANKHFPLGQTIDFGTWRKKSCETGKRNANQLNFLFILGISWLDQIQT